MKRLKILCVNDGCIYRSKKDTCKNSKFSMHKDYSKRCGTRITEDLSWPPRSVTRPLAARIAKAKEYCKK
jgi:hypothetical protein